MDTSIAGWVNCAMTVKPMGRPIHAARQTVRLKQLGPSVDLPAAFAMWKNDARVVVEIVRRIARPPIFSVARQWESVTSRSAATVEATTVRRTR